MANRKIVDKLLRKAARNDNVLSYSEVMKTIEDAEIDVDETEQILDALEEAEVTIDADNVIDVDDDDDDEEDDDFDSKKNAQVAVDDPVRMYLKEIGKVE